jgi:glycosyltransferase involved in cell wall biosynthesis
MPPATVAPAHKGGGTDTFMRSLFELARRDGSGILFDVVALAPEDEAMAPPPGVGVYFVRSRILNALLFTFREGRNPVANVVLLVATSGALAVRALMQVRRQRYDAVYGMGGPIAGVAAAIVGGLRRLPAAVHFHWAYRFAAAGRMVRSLVRRFYERFTLVIGNSRLLAEDAASLGVRRTRFVWVYNWVDNTFFRPLPNRDEIRRRWDLPADRFVFFYAGRFDWSKQVDKIIAALSAHRYDATFLFAGDGTLRPELERLAPFNDVRVLGTRTSEELVELHNAADVMLWGSVDVDYPGLVVMEAMASGLPVATASTSMNPLYPGVAVDANILGGPGLTRHYPASPEGIDAAIRDSLARRDDLAALRPAARKFAVERFGESNAQSFLDLLASLKPT